ncbi:hypothetical protein BDA96_04G220600 [Sorghum bicolor]|uniref:DUF1618 domain-containing protein n=1 Tax=Sorghum bicolor TaxID=4558 RepID=A0A921R477_SORBI|nr:uncharacterized protein LOC8056495 isoform X2 [Sorghum bicolor]KAG0533759.1 hypothetical protein BDA96_04G220600 [Sorghum bicolor]|eukprot:XP_021314214.1 uncharacterized protein LOC8056495 isoform X2 [Sorghum bicolor]
MASRIDLINPHGDRGDPVPASRRPVSILLDEQRAHFIDCRNETTATAKSRAGYTISVSFWMADPPDMSFFSVHCTKPPGSKSRTADFKLLPHVVGAEGRFVLLRARFFSRYGRDEYFMYQVGDGRSPSLEWIPLPDADNDATTRMVKDFGIVPRDPGGHYLLAALAQDHDAPSEYHLQIYSSKNKSWSTRTLLDPCPAVERMTPEKVIIRLEEGILGWVDFSQGLLVCDLRQDPPSAHFIPLPKPLPENREKLKLPSTGASARSFRDITCVNGLLKFIEMVQFQVTEELSDSGDEDCLYDSDLIRSLKRKRMDEKPKPRHGWRAVTWSRMVSSNCWRKGYVVDVADVSVDASAHSLLLSGLRDDNFGKLTFRDLLSAFPTLSTCLDDTLYLKTMVEPSDQSGCVVAVDLGNKTVKALGAYSFEDRDPFKQPFRPCALPCHLNMSPGVKVSACHEITQVGSSANCPDNTSISMDEPILGQPRLLHERIKHARNGGQSIVQKDHISQVHTVQNMVESSKLQRPLDEKINPSQNEAQSILRNDHISQACPVQNSLVESTGKLPRPMGEETNCSRNEDQCVVQSDHVSLVRPQNNSFKWDRPMYTGQSRWMYPGQPWWHHQHMPFEQPQQLLQSTVPNDPGYAQLAPAPSLHGYVNYQPVWQQPLPTRFGSHEVPQTCFNECNGASYHGYSPQLPPPKSFAHGAHSSYDNNQPQWQKQWHIPDMPACASWQHPDQVPH